MAGLVFLVRKRLHAGAILSSRALTNPWAHIDTLQAIYFGEVLLVMRDKFKQCVADFPNENIASYVDWYQGRRDLNYTSNSDLDRQRKTVTINTMAERVKKVRGSLKGWKRIRAGLRGTEDDDTLVARVSQQSNVSLPNQENS